MSGTIERNRYIYIIYMYIHIYTSTYTYELPWVIHLLNYCELYIHVYYLVELYEENLL